MSSLLKRNIIYIASFVFATIFIFPEVSFAQNKKLKKKENDASGNFADGNYDVALSQYLKIFPKDKKNVDYNYKIGVCYVMTNIDKTLGLPYLEFAVKEGYSELDAFYYLGLAYFYSHKFDLALDMYNKYLDLAKNDLARDSEEKEKVDRAIEVCKNAKDFVKRPLNVTFMNLGKNVNSNKADYFPFISEDEKSIFYTSNKKYISDFQEFVNDIFYSSITFWGRWGGGKSISSKVNTSDENEIMVGMSLDAEQVLVKPDNGVGFQDIFVSKKEKGRYNELETLGEFVNTKAHESGAALTYGKDTLIFASDRAGGFGGMDLWMSIKLPNGSWGPAQNLGENINTKYNEDMPYISRDGKSLYFSSEGHNSMGGYDIFHSRRKEITEAWPKPKNMGYPISDTYDNKSFCMSEKGRYGYVSAVRKEGLGDFDIYKVVFNSQEAQQIVFRGKIAVGDSLKAKSPKDFDTDISIIVKEKLANDIFGRYAYNKKNDTFVISLPPGMYDIEVESSSYQPYKKTIEVFDEMANEGVLLYNIFLKKK